MAEEMAHACETRVDFLWVLYDRLLKVSQNIVRALWSDQAEGVPANQVAAWPEHAVDRFEAWRVSSARGGARITLTFAISWYSGINLGQLATMGATSQVDLAQREEAIDFRAHELTSYATLYTYYPELREDGMPLPQDDYGFPIFASEEEVGSSLEECEGDGGSTKAAAGGEAESFVQGTHPPAGDAEEPLTGGSEVPPTGDVEVSPNDDAEAD